MLPVLRRQPPGVQAAIAAAGFAAIGVAFRPANPWQVLVGAVVFGSITWLMARRRTQGKPELPRKVVAAFSVGALALYVWAFFVVQQPSGAEWIAAALIFLFPLVLLWNVVRRRGQP